MTILAVIMMVLVVAAFTVYINKRRDLPSDTASSVFVLALSGCVMGIMF